MRETLESLIRLQDIDCELRALEQSKGDLPQKVNGLVLEIAQLEEMIADRHARILSAQTELRDILAEIATLRELLKKYQSQLYQVKTNKEYDAITVELETTETTIGQQEYKALDIEESEKNLQTDVTALVPQLEEQKNILKDHQQRLEHMLAQTRELEASLIERRQAITVTLTRQVLSTYERIRQGRSGIAVAFLKDGACSQCSSRIPPQRGLEIRMMNRIHICEVCGRIMLWHSERDWVCSAPDGNGNNSPKQAG